MSRADARPDPAAARPATICRYLLAALAGSDGRQRKRKRDTRPDVYGLGLKRRLLEEAARDDPAPEDFEAWLLERCLAAGPGSGALRAMALGVLDEWRFAQASPSFHAWLAAGAPSDDAGGSRE